MILHFSIEERKWVYRDNGYKIKEGWPSNIRKPLEEKLQLFDDISRKQYELWMKWKRDKESSIIENRVD